MCQDDNIKEAFIIKVNARAEKRKKLKCPAGMKPNAAGTSCVPMDASEKRNRRVGLRKANLNKKAQGTGLKTRTLRKQRKAMRFRKMMGLGS